MKFNCVLLTFNILNDSTFPVPLLFFSLCSVYLLLASCEGGWEDGPVWYFKIVNIVVSIKTRDLSATEKGTMIFIAAIPTGFLIANQKTRRRSKTLKGS